MEFVTGVAILYELEKVLNKRLENSFGGNGKRVQKSEKIGKNKRRKTSKYNSNNSDIDFIAEVFWKLAFPVGIAYAIKWNLFLG